MNPVQWCSIVVWSVCLVHVESNGMECFWHFVLISKKWILILNDKSFTGVHFRIQSGHKSPGKNTSTPFCLCRSIRLVCAADASNNSKLIDSKVSRQKWVGRRRRERRQICKKVARLVPFLVGRWFGKNNKIILYLYQYYMRASAIGMDEGKEGKNNGWHQHALPEQELHRKSISKLTTNGGN